MSLIDLKRLLFLHLKRWINIMLVKVKFFSKKLYFFDNGLFYLSEYNKITLNNIIPS